jgi:octaprenyl-diphosphate synthase
VTIDFMKPVIGADMAAVDRVLRASLDSDVVLVRQVAEYIVGGGGKRLRPALLLLTAGATGYAGTDHHTLAAVVEMIHTATLLHDDVIDEALRNARPGYQPLP